jgi:hypothetical protein
MSGWAGFPAQAGAAGVGTLGAGPLARLSVAWGVGWTGTRWAARGAGWGAAERSI